MSRSALAYEWTLNRLRWIAGIVGAYGSMFALGVTLLGVGILGVISLIPLYLNKTPVDPLGEIYCINNYSLTVGFQIPQYNSTFTDTVTSGNYSVTSSNPQFTSYVANCAGTIEIGITGNEQATDICNFQLLSIVYPATPYAQVFDSYALSQACYQTLQSCYYDPLLSSCLLSDCFVVSLVNTTGSASYPLTYYVLSCTANIYYKARCPDTPASYGLNYSSSQNNGACRQKRLNRINTCLNSTASLSNVPCLISVSSAKMTSETATCNQTIVPSNFVVYIVDLTYGNSSSTTITLNTLTGTLASTFTVTIFTASDQNVGHVYQISSINSEYYGSTQVGALYCGDVTQTQIAASITSFIDSQTSG